MLGAQYKKASFWKLFTARRDRAESGVLPRFS